MCTRRAVSQEKALVSFIDEVDGAVKVKTSAQETLSRAQGYLEKSLTGQVAFLAAKKFEDCKRGDVDGKAVSGYLTIVPVDWWGNQVTDSKPNGKDKNGNTAYKKVPRKVRVKSEFCIKCTVEELDAVRKHIQEAIAKCEKTATTSMLARGSMPHEIDELKECLDMLDKGKKPDERANEQTQLRNKIEAKEWSNFQKQGGGK